MWSSAIVTPNFKKDLRKALPVTSDAACYRHVSLKCVACKMDVVSSKQQLLSSFKECCIDWNLALNAGNAVGVVDLGCAGAFDSVICSIQANCL